MRQPFKDKFLSDVDGDGCPIPYRVPLALINIGRAEDHPLVQALLADHKCLNCPPTEQCSRSGYCEQRNPEGWREVDGVKLPPINWADFSTLADGTPVPATADYAGSEQRITTWVDEARQLVCEADLRMDVFTGQRDKGDALRALYGVERLSDSAAPDAFIGRKS